MPRVASPVVGSRLAPAKQRPTVCVGRASEASEFAMSYRRFFEKLTGFSPHPYQERFAEKLLQGHSIILRVPTGAGKTWAAVAPFLYTLAENHRLADRLLYALPLRSLASSLFATVHENMSGF